MNQNERETEYTGLIRKIRRRRKWVIALTLIAVFAVIAFGFPAQLEIMGETILDSKGWHPALIILLILLILFVEFIVYAAVSIPAAIALDQECDPEKHLVLNTALTKPNQLDPLLAADYLYLGKYPEALMYAERMAASKNETTSLSGLFCKARCEFLLGNDESFRQTSEEFRERLSGNAKRKPKTQATLLKMEQVLELLRAISDNDTEKIKDLRTSIQCWDKSKATEGFVHYLKGLAAYKTGDRKQAIYRFMTVTENYPKIIFAKYSEEYLSGIEIPT